MSLMEGDFCAKCNTGTWHINGTCMECKKAEGSSLLDPGELEKQAKAELSMCCQTLCDKTKIEEYILYLELLLENEGVNY